MEHIGIDLGGMESQVCIRDGTGKILLEQRRATTALGALLRARPPGRVVMESCAEAFAIAAQAKQAGHDVRVIPATLVRTLGVGARRIKTDRRDAQVQSEVSCRIDLPSIHIPSMASRELKALLNMRDMLVSTRTMFMSGVRSYMRGHLIRVKGTPETFPEHARKRLLQEPTGMPASIERLLCVLDELNKQIKDADEELGTLVDGHAICRLLRTAPCVGPVTAARFASTIDDPKRFPNAKALVSYVGLSPGESSSSNRKHRTGITKAGPSELRRCLVQVGWAIWRTRPTDPLRVWAASIHERHGKQIAVTAMARKLAGILWAMWRDNRGYVPRQVS